MTTLQLVISLGSTAYAGSVAGAAIGWVARARLEAYRPAWKPEVYGRLRDDSVPVKVTVSDDDRTWCLADAASYASRPTVAEVEALCEPFSPKAGRGVK
jgi:hypothetical protein